MTKMITAAAVALSLALAGVAAAQDATVQPSPTVTTKDATQTTKADLMDLRISIPGLF